MVQCKICMVKTGQSKQYSLITLHLLYIHGMLVKEYRSLHPTSKLSDSKFRLKKRKQMLKQRKENPYFQLSCNKWLDIKIQPQPPEFFDNLNFDDLEALHRREKHLRLNLGCGLRGRDYRNRYRELLETRQIIAVLVERLGVEE